MNLLGKIKVGIAKIKTMTTSGELINEIYPTDLVYHNMMIEGDAGFQIDSAGDIEIISSTILGAKLIS